MNVKNRQIGQTKDVGFQVGARRTFDISMEKAWQLVISKKGLQIWLGDINDFEFGKDTTYKTSGGITGEIRVFKPNSHLRITWFPPSWPRASTIQVRVISAGKKTTISFHQEHLPGANERQERLEFFKNVLNEFEKNFFIK